MPRVRGDESSPERGQEGFRVPPRLLGFTEGGNLQSIRQDNHQRVLTHAPEQVNHILVGHADATV